MRTGVVLVAVGAAMLGACAPYGHGGLPRLARIPALDCGGLETARTRVDQAAERLQARAERNAEPSGRETAQALDHWPAQIYLRGKGGVSRQRYQALSMTYEQLRYSARGKGCALALAPDVAKAAVRR